AFILQDTIECPPNFQDDVNILRPHTCYELANGAYKTIPPNCGIRQFVWEHCLDNNHIFHHLKLAGATVSALKLFLCVTEVTIVGQQYTYEGRIPDQSKVSKNINWPTCSSKTDVRAFSVLWGPCGIG
ncbi:hypothetical protein CY34DRAFT_93591, partial [Suillus luteus UH-Slu-Lm8-n1]